MTTLEPHDTDVQISGLVTGLPEHIEAASSATLSAHMALTDLASLNDIDLFDGQDGHDALAELTEAMRHLRNARRIAERRLELLTEDDPGRLAEQVRRAHNLAASLRAHEADLLRRHDAAARDEEATALLSSAALTGDIARQLEEALAEDATGRQ